MPGRKRYRTAETISTRRLEKIRSALERRQLDATVVIENVHDPHNVSAVLRTADAAGLRAVHLIYTRETMPKLGRRSSASAKKWVEVRTHASVEECYAALRSEGFRIYASRLTGTALSLYDLDLTAPVALVLGNEHRGVSDEACARADGVFAIPMMGMIQSLNISVAAAVGMYEILRQRVSAGMYGAVRWDETQFARMLEDWASR